MTFQKMLAVMVGGALMVSSFAGWSNVYADEYVGDQALYNDLSYDDTEIMEAARWANGGVFGCVFSKDNVSFKDGIMTLKIDKNTNSKYDYEYSGAEYRTKGTYKYGLYSVKMKPIKNDGVVSSFFTYTGPAHGTIWDEIDIEFLGKDTTKVQFNFFADGEGDHEYIYELGFDASEEWHEYAFLWEEDAITWYVDGVAVHKVTSESYTLPKTESKIMMNVWNGRTDMSNIRAWLNEYDGTVGLTAKYDYFSYIPISEYEASEEAPSVSEQPDVESDIYFPMHEERFVKNYGKAGQKGVSGSYDMPVKADYFRAAGNENKNPEKKENCFVQKIVKEKYQNGMTAVELPIDTEHGCVRRIRIYMNSDNGYFDVTKHAYCRFFVPAFSISN